MARHNVCRCGAEAGAMGMMRRLVTNAYRTMHMRTVRYRDAIMRCSVLIDSIGGWRRDRVQHAPLKRGQRKMHYDPMGSELPLVSKRRARKMHYDPLAVTLNYLRAQGDLENPLYRFHLRSIVMLTLTEMLTCFGIRGTARVLGQIIRYGSSANWLHATYPELAR